VPGTPQRHLGNSAPGIPGPVYFTPDLRTLRTTAECGSYFATGTSALNLRSVLGVLWTRMGRRSRPTRSRMTHSGLRRRWPAVGGCEIPRMPADGSPLIRYSAVRGPGSLLIKNRPGDAGELVWRARFAFWDATSVDQMACNANSATGSVGRWLLFLLASGLDPKRLSQWRIQLPLGFEDRFREEHRPSHSLRRSYVDNLVLIAREQPLLFGEGGRAFKCVEVAGLRGVPLKRLFARELPSRHSLSRCGICGRSGASLIVAFGCPSLHVRGQRMARGGETPCLG
jgi:hypothetical protein